MDTVRTLVSAQFLVTSFLAVLLWSLHTRLHRAEFNRWWVAAWTLSAMFLAVGRLALAFPRSWTFIEGSVVLLATLMGFLVAPLLVFGAISFRSPGSITRHVAFAGGGLGLLLGVGAFASSMLWSNETLVGFSVRNGARTIVLSAALFFCAWVFFERVRLKRSTAALISGICCLGFGVTQAVYAGAMLTHVINSSNGNPGPGRLALQASIKFLYADVLLICGLCLGMILLLVEAHQRAEGELRESLSRGREVSRENSALQEEIQSREEVERQLAASEDRYRDLVEHSEDLICTHDLNTGRILSCNRAAARQLGYEVNEMLGRPMQDLLAPEVRQDWDDYLTVIKRDRSARGLMRVMTRDGRRRVWSYQNTLRVDGVDAPIVRGMARDITEQHSAERALRRSEEKFSIAFRSSPSAKAIISIDTGRFLDVNAAFEAISGYHRGELLHRKYNESGIWCDAADLDVLGAVLRKDRRLTAREMCVRHISGRESTVVFSAEVVTVSGEACVLLAGLDATARKDAESRHHAFLKALPDWIFLIDSSGVYVEFHGNENGLLHPPSEFIGRNMSEVLPPDLAVKAAMSNREALRTGEPVTMEYSLQLEGEERHYEVRTVRSDKDHVLSLVRDVTDRKRAEFRARELRDELTHAGRVMALGTLNGSLAHEVNQPLAAIATNAFVAKRLLNETQPRVGEVRELLDDIVTDSRRIDDVLRRMRMLLKKDRRVDAVVDVNTIVSDVLKLVNTNLIERRITTEVVLESQPSEVIGDRIQLQQVVLNLLMNAADAVSGASGYDRMLKVTTAKVDGQLIVSVSDRGDVIPEASFSKMFDPFFTTKRDGMGLGLSICRAIMEAHGGEISARRNKDRGLTCWFSLEALDAGAAPKPADTRLPVESQHA